MGNPDEISSPPAARVEIVALGISILRLTESTRQIKTAFHRKLTTRPIEKHTGKIHMHFVTSVLYEITCIPSNTDKPDTDSDVGLCVLI